MRGPYFRRLCRYCLLSGAVVLLLLVAARCRRGEGPSRSERGARDANILLITLDTTRADHLRCYGPPSAAGGASFQQPNTPNLDALAARGVMFTQATTQVPLTLPAHASIMTGTYPTAHGVRENEGFILDKSHATLASIAQGKGFATAAFVGSRVLARDFGLANGFASYDDDMGDHGDGNDSAGLYAERLASQVTERALQWLKENGRKRFFLWAHYFDPHAPYNPPEPYRRMYARDPYSGEIAYMDEQVGRLLGGLEQLGLTSGTIVAVIGDHGESLGEHGELTHGVFLYDSTLRVPFLLAGPDIPPGKVVREQVRSIDVMPTLLEYVHLPPGPDVQGASLRPLIRQGSRAGSGHSYAETLYPRTYMGWSELRAIRTDTMKLIVAPRPELYDVARDPGERNNLIANSRPEAEQLGKKLWEIAGEQRRRETIVSGPVPRNTMRALESLGYLSGGRTSGIQLGTPAPDPKDRVAVLKIFSLVEDLMSGKEYARAARFMEEALRLDPTNPRGHLYLATAYEQMGQFQRAVQVFQHALAAKVRTDRILARLGVDYLHLGRLDKAIDIMEQAVVLNPADLNNLRNLGMACLQLGRLDDAERAFRAITAQDDRYADAHNGLGLVAVQRGDTGTARREFERAVEVNPHEVKSLLDLGILHHQLGNREKARHYLELFAGKAPAGQYADQLPAVRETLRELSRDVTQSVER